MAVHDRLRQPGGAGGEQDVERVVERQRVEREPAGLGEEVVPGDRVGLDGVVPRRVRDLDDVTRGSAGSRAPRRLLAPVDLLVPVPIAGDRQEDLRLELAEAVDGRCATPNSGGHVAQIAPRLALARKPTSVSGMFGR